MATPNPFPAVEALEQFGENAGSTVLLVIESGSTSALARENALHVYMLGIYKYDRPKAIEQLKSERAKASVNEAKKNLTWALNRALRYCGPAEKSSCREAAIGVPSK